MIPVIRNFYTLLIDSGKEFGKDQAIKLSASLAYFTLFSVGPLLLLIITVLGFFYRKDYITSEVFGLVKGVIGQSGTDALQSILINMSKQTNTTFMGIVGTLVFIFGATGIFSEIQSSINFMWSIKVKPKSSVLKYFRDRVLSLLLVIGIGFLMLITVLLNLLIDLLSSHIEHYFEKTSIILLKLANFGLLFIIVTLVFTVIFKVLPDAWIRWKDAFKGALFTSALFLIGKFLISYYLGVSMGKSAYGAATSIILVLSWVYYSSLILYFGAEFTKCYAIKWGGGIIGTDKTMDIVKKDGLVLPKI